MRNKKRRTATIKFEEIFEVYSVFIYTDDQ